MWKCEKCETLNEGVVCVVCGEERMHASTQNKQSATSMSQKNQSQPQVVINNNLEMEKRTIQRNSWISSIVFIVLLLGSILCIVIENLFWNTSNENIRRVVFSISILILFTLLITILKGVFQRNKCKHLMKKTPTASLIACGILLYLLFIEILEISSHEGLSLFRRYFESPIQEVLYNIFGNYASLIYNCGPYIIVAVLILIQILIDNKINGNRQVQYD